MTRWPERQAPAWIAACTITALAWAADVDRRLTITGGTASCEFSAKQLLAHRSVETLTIRDVSAYPRQTMTYRAIPIAELLKCARVDRKARVEFAARDGFTANLPGDALLNTAASRSVAYLAIEDPAAPWPPHVSGDGTAGPFYLVWKNPELSRIGREEWPFKFNRIAVKNELARTYGEIVPPAEHSNGFDVYVKNCLACHKLNGVGPGALGPDLNHPMSPTEYFVPGILRQYIRNPQSVRAHKRTAMGPFPPGLISDTELDQLIAYLSYMAGRKPK